MDCRITTMSKMKNTVKTIYSIALVLSTFTLQAQESFPDDVNDVPIDDYNWIFAAAIIGIVIGYWSFQKKKIVK
jgi:hypothetical protein